MASFEITKAFKLPSTWITILEGIIFLPLIMIDGMIINGEYVLGDIGDLFPYDSVVLMCIDTALYVKLQVFFFLQN